MLLNLTSRRGKKTIRGIEGKMMKRKEKESEEEAYTEKEEKKKERGK